MKLSVGKIAHAKENRLGWGQIHGKQELAAGLYNISRYEDQYISKMTTKAIAVNTQGIRTAH